MPNTRTIAVSMRTANANGYDEPRDALARDWYRFLGEALPAHCRFLLLPNLGVDVRAYLARFDVDGLLLTGGDDPGESQIRDQTESAALEWALETEVPTFGVCRGIQFVQRYYGGDLVPCDPSRHVAQQHPIEWTLPVAADWQRLPEPPEVVNSYHGLGIRIEDLASPLVALAATQDGYVEGAYHPSTDLIAVQWHPERDPHCTQRRSFDLALLRLALRLA